MADNIPKGMEDTDRSQEDQGILQRVLEERALLTHGCQLIRSISLTTFTFRNTIFVLVQAPQCIFK